MNDLCPYIQHIQYISEVKFNFMIRTKCQINWRWPGQNAKKNETDKIPNDNNKNPDKMLANHLAFYKS